MNLFSKSIMLGLIFFAFSLTSCHQTNNQGDNTSSSGKTYKAPKYIFYLIGDGMATPQINMAEAALHNPKFRETYEKEMRDYVTDSIGIGKLYLRNFPIVGMCTTFAKDRYITDSAAAATALACGHKTSVGSVGVDESGEKNYESIAEKAHKKGMKVGIVTSVSIDHATPAGFYAHSDSRNNYELIGNQMLTSNFDYFGGGTVRWNSRKTLKNAAEFREAAQKKGYKYIDTRADFEALNNQSGKVIATINSLGEGGDVSDGSSLPYTIDHGRLDEENKIYLADFVKKGITLLDNEDKGFFMMIESGKIDWAGHANDAVASTYEVITLDQAISVALDFYKQHPEETLIVVTGDHETGGLTLGFAGTHYQTSIQKLQNQNISFQRFSEKVKEWKKSGSMSFEKAMKIADADFGINKQVTLNDYDLKRLREAFTKSMKGILPNVSKEELEIRYGSYDPFTVTITHILNNKVGIAYASYSHTAVPVPVFAIGQGAEEFNGYYDNTDIPKKIRKIADL